MSNYQPPSSLGSKLLPAGLHRRLQFERHPVQDYIRRVAVPLLRPGQLVLNAGSGSEAEQDTRDALNQSGAVIHKSDIGRRAGLEYVADLHAMPVSNAVYDVILCTQVLEHVRYPARVMTELARMLKPGGTLFLTAPQSAFLHDLPHHYFNFTCNGLRLLMEDAGLEVVGMEPQGGHYLCLGWQLHYTCTVMRERMTATGNRLWLLPLTLSRVLFGLLTKLVCLWLDRYDPVPKNTMGWNVQCRKPAHAQSPVAA